MLIAASQSLPFFFTEAHVQTHMQSSSFKLMEEHQGQGGF